METADWKEAAAVWHVSEDAAENERCTVRACREDVGEVACDGGLCGAGVEQEGKVFAGIEGIADADEGTSGVVDELGGDDRMRKSRAFGVHEGRCHGRECRSEERSVGERAGWNRQVCGFDAEGALRKYAKRMLGSIQWHRMALG